MTLLYLALVLPLDEILSPLVFGEELQLLGINGAPPLLPDQVDRVLVLHSQLNQRCCNQHRRSAKPSDTVNTNTCVLVFLELCVYQREPPFNDLLSRCRAIREGELRHSNTWIELQSHRPSISVWLLRVAGWINQIQRSGMDYFKYMLLLTQSEF